MRLLTRRPVLWFWLLVVVFWTVVWRTPIWSADDLYFATRSGTAGGAIDWASFIHFFGSDLMDRNGRAADMLVQLAMATGPWIRLLLVASSLSMSVVMWIMFREVIRSILGAVGHAADLLVAVVAFAIPMTLVSADPQRLGGRTLLFVSANFGYATGFALALGAVVLLWNGSSPQPGKRSVALWSGAILGCIAGLFHELNSFGLLGAIVALAVARRKSLRTPPVGAALAVTAAFNVARMAMPGLWSRNTTMRPPFPLPENTGQLATVAPFAVHFAVHALTRYSVVYWAAAVAVVSLSVLAVRRDVHRRGVLVFLTIFCAASLGLWVMSNRIMAVLALRKAHGSWPLYVSTTGHVAALLVGLILVSTLVLAILISDLEGASGAVVSLGLAMGYHVLVILRGTSGGRTLFMPLLATLLAAAVWALVLVCLEVTAADGAVADLCREGADAGAGNSVGLALHHRRGVGLGAAVVTAFFVGSCCVGPGVDGANNMVAATTLNGSAWRGVERQISLAKAGERSTVILPSRLPAPGWLPDYAAARESAVERVRQYYDLPASVEVTRR